MVREIHMYRNKRQDITHVFIFTKIAKKISLFWEAEVSLTLRAGGAYLSLLITFSLAGLIAG